MKKGILFGALLVGAAIANAQSSTIATFQDPAVSSDTPLFFFNTATNILTGSWTGPGLNLHTPGFVGGGTVSNAKMQMDPVAFTPVGSTGIFTGGAGQVKFYTNDVNNPFFVINFTGATLFNPLNFGASEFAGSSVSFSGTNVPAGLTSEQFSFALANPRVGQEGGLLYTASFTSSAVPEPATMTALALGAAAMLRRRKKA